MLLKNLQKRNMDGKFVNNILGKCSQLCFLSTKLRKKCHTIIVDFFAKNNIK